MMQLAGNVELTRRKPVDAAEAVAMTMFEFKRLAGSVVYGLKEIVTNFSSTAEQVSGPIAIISVGAELARNDLANLYQFAAIVNINLAVVNTLPLPALDGGYLFLLMVEAARGKKLPQEVEQAVMSSGFLLLLTLGVGLIIRDTINLF
jgi:RIP metalloprotease RseP